jgi:hypothetical protein
MTKLFVIIEWYDLNGELCFAILIPVIIIASLTCILGYVIGYMTGKEDK